MSLRVHQNSNIRDLTNMKIFAVLYFAAWEKREIPFIVFNTYSEAVHYIWIYSCQKLKFIVVCLF